MSSFSTRQRRTAMSDLIGLSRLYGSDTDFIIAGGGNTSVKIGNELWVKASGARLAETDESTFVGLARDALDDVLVASYPENAEEREKLVKRGLLRALIRPDEGGRPSVEASLHNLLLYRFVVHTHPWKVNALTCARNGMETLKKRFAHRAIFVPYTDPGYTLATKLDREIKRYVAVEGTDPKIAFLGNHGLIVAADTADEIRSLTAMVISECEPAIETPSGPASVTAAKATEADVAALVNVVRSSLSVRNRKTTALLRVSLTDTFCASLQAFRAVALPFTPDQIVYCGSHPLYVSGAKDRDGLIRNYLRALGSHRTRHGDDPSVICVQGIGLIAVGDTAADAAIIADVFHDAMKVAHASTGAGGPRPMSAKARHFIESWEVEKYRRGVSLAGAGGAVAGRTAVVTGGAQGFGEGIVRALYDTGYNVVVADLNAERGEALARELRGEHAADVSGAATQKNVGRRPAHGHKNGVRFVEANVADEESVRALLDRTLLEFGGCDLFVSNAGVLRAGGLDEIDAKTFEFMTDVNYKGYFICAKYASAVMKRQFEHAPHYFSDIIQINSKSGLEGSNRNFTYAGGKFGGIGLTQSFALELMPYRIKVNSICPGNFLDGPLWSDPKSGLFVQYLKAGKVPGATTTEEVRRAYEAKVPAGRGCTVDDVMKAIHYIVEQEYETGQAVPVTGGQVMLR